MNIPHSGKNQNPPYSVKTKAKNIISDFRLRIGFAELAFGSVVDLASPSWSSTRFGF